MWSETRPQKWAIICIVLQCFTTGRPVSSNGDECASRTEQSCPALDTPINTHGMLGSPIQSSPYKCNGEEGTGNESGFGSQAPRAAGVGSGEGALAACWAVPCHCISTHLLHLIHGSTVLSRNYTKDTLACRTP